MRDPDRPWLPDQRMIPKNHTPGWFEDRPGQAPPAEELVGSDEQFVRPFVITSGRTMPLMDGLRIETLVQAPPSALSAPLQFEQRTVVQLCQRPHSIAEIGTALHVPVGVAKVIVSDLAAGGYVTVRESDQLSTAAIERIRDLVRAL
ncbi:DUF742 domain-containing protein [Nocardia sp. NPDC052566]|uniref:DUF742 domain-containing protein n=1 Tax=Nocardia sp. NPDC052566 TaxID=3364330 RepID=UPI0037C720D6